MSSSWAETVNKADVRSGLSAAVSDPESNFQRQCNDVPRHNAPQWFVMGVKRDAHCCSRLDLHGTVNGVGNDIQYMSLSHARCN